jgi:hypothetical protein
MRYLRSLVFSNRASIGVFIFISLYSGALFAFATTYVPQGTILDPAGLPGSYTVTPGVSYAGPVTSGHDNEVLYMDGSGNLASDAFFTRDSTTQATSIFQSSGNILRGLGIAAFNPDNVVLANLDTVAGDGVLISLKQADPTAPRLRLNVDYATGSIESRLDMDSDPINGGNTLTWDADTTDTFETSLIQNQSIFGLGVPGTAIAYQDTNTSQKAYAAAFKNGGNIGAAMASIDATSDISSQSVVIANSNVGFISDYNKASINQRSYIQLNGSYNKLSWDFDTTDTVTTGLEQSEDILNLGAASGSFNYWQDTNTNVTAIAGTGVIAGTPGVSMLNTLNTVTGDYAQIFTSYDPLLPETLLEGSVKNGTKIAALNVNSTAASLGYTPDNLTTLASVAATATEAHLRFDNGTTAYQASLADGVFQFYNATNADQYLVLNSATGNYSLGDVSGGTFLAIDTAAQAVSVTDLFTISTTSTNLGYQAGYSNTTGTQNIFTGFHSGYANTEGSFNTFLGYNAGAANTQGNNNSFFGYQTGQANTTGSGNVGLGNQALHSQTTGNNNFGLGNQAGYSTNGSDNIYIGRGTGFEHANGDDNVFIGTTAGWHWATSNGQVAIGRNALLGNVTTASNTGLHNTAIGYAAGTKIDGGSDNVITGYEAGVNTTSGSSNIFSGYRAGYSTTTANDNIFLGTNTGHTNTIGYDNIFLGGYAGYTNLDGYRNIFFGANAGYNNIDGYNNVFTGYQAGFSNTSGAYNVFSGTNAGYNSISGTGNTFLGGLAGDNVSTGSKNIIIGYGIDAPSTSADGQLSIGNLIFGTGMDGTGTTPSTGNVGIGVADPQTLLHLYKIATAPMIRLENSETNMLSGMEYAGIQFYGNDATGSASGIRAKINSIASGAGGQTDLAFYTTSGGSSTLNEVMRISKDQFVGIGDATPDYALDVEQTSVDTDIFALHDSDGSCLHNPEAGSEIVTCSSDERLKTNIIDSSSVLDYFNSFKIREYDVIASGDHMFGVIAQEVQALHPELVSESTDGMLSVQLPNQWKLVKAIQELDLKIKSISDLSDTSDTSFAHILVEFFASTTNGITDFFAGRVHTNELCVGEVCVTESQFLEMVQATSSNSGTSSSEDDTSSGTVGENQNTDSDTNIETGDDTSTSGDEGENTEVSTDANSGDTE